jgi:hypothetical protein
MTTDRDYAEWLRSNPALGLQALVECHGGYDKITPEAWAEHDRALADWQERQGRRAEEGGQAADTRSDLGALCICGSPGVVSRPRKRGTSGGPIWRCEQHRNLWPDYAEEIPARRAAE